jgi:hypothetical protein
MTGYRAWQVDDQGVLHPLSSIARLLGDGAWEAPGTVTARCLRSSAYHVSPDPECRCGVWVMSSLYDLDVYLLRSGVLIHKATHQGTNPLVIGSVEAWGRMIAHEAGTRCQYTQVTGLLDSTLVMSWFLADPEIVQKAARRYDVPLLIPSVEFNDPMKPWTGSFLATGEWPEAWVPMNPPLNLEPK